MSKTVTFPKNRRRAAVACSALLLASTAYAALRVTTHEIRRDGHETRMNVILKVPYGSVAVSKGDNPDINARVESQTDDPNEDPPMHLRQFYAPVGAISTLRITLGTDEGMIDKPKEFAYGSWASTGLSLASASDVQTDAGTYRLHDASTIYAPPAAPTPSTDNELSKVFLNPSLPMYFHAELGFGESMIDFTGLSVMNATVETNASRTRILERTPNPIPMDNCSINAGLGECSIDGICNFNCKHFNFSGGIGYYELVFTGGLQQNMDAHVEVGCGKVVINIPPNSARVQVRYDDSFFSSFSSQGLDKRSDGYYTSSGFDQSNAPILTLHLSTGVGKMVVNYH